MSWFAGQPPLSSTNEVPAGGPEEDRYTEDYEAEVFARLKQAQLEKQQQGEEKELNQ